MPTSTLASSLNATSRIMVNNSKSRICIQIFSCADWMPRTWILHLPRTVQSNHTGPSSDYDTARRGPSLQWRDLCLPRLCLILHHHALLSRSGKVGGATSHGECRCGNLSRLVSRSMIFLAWLGMDTDGRSLQCMPLIMAMHARMDLKNSWNNL